MVIVTISAFITVFFSAENTTKRTLSRIAAEYYEEYLYPTIDHSDEKFTTTMETYAKSGLTPTTLRQLLLYDHQKNAALTPALQKYCDENHTRIKYYPEPPFTKTSYRIEFTYSCDF